MAESLSQEDIDSLLAMAAGGPDAPRKVYEYRAPTVWSICGALEAGDLDANLDELQAAIDAARARTWSAQASLDCLLELEDRCLETLVRTLERPTLLLAARCMSVELVERIKQSGMSRQGRRDFDEDWVAMGPRSNASIQEAKQALLGTYQRLCEQGKVIEVGGLKVS